MNEIPVVLSSSGQYTDYLLTTISSVLLHGGDQTKFSFYVFHHKISEEKQQELRKQLHRWPEHSLQFVGIGEYALKTYGISADQLRARQTCYPLLAPEMLPHVDKAVCLDCDIIVNADLADLYATALDGNYIAAVLDLDFIGHYHSGNRNYRKYYHKEAPLPDPYRYFQAGVTLQDFTLLRKSFPNGTLFCDAVRHKYHYDDQDVMNMYLQDKVKLLDMRWNVIHDNRFNRVRYVCALAPKELYRQYLESRKDPWIVHYAGDHKPWNDTRCDFGDCFWSVADQTPAAEQLRKRLAAATGTTPPPSFLRRVYYAMRHLYRKTRMIFRRIVTPARHKRRQG